MDMMSELVGYIREAIDRKQENMRRRRRRDALRLALVRLFEIITEEKTFSRTPTVIDADSGFLASTFTDYIDGARYVFGHSVMPLDVLGRTRATLKGSSVMPLDVLGRTRATLKGSACSPFP